MRKDPTSFLVTILPGDSFDTVGDGCTRLPSASGSVLVATCVGATRMIYRGEDGQPVLSKVSFGGANQAIPLQLEALLATGSLGSDNEFLITFDNANLPNVVDAGGGTDTLTLQSIITVLGQQQPVLHYAGDGIANDGYDGLAAMNLNGFEKFSLAGAGYIHAGPENPRRRRQRPALCGLGQRHPEWRPRRRHVAGQHGERSAPDPRRDHGRADQLRRRRRHGADRPQGSQAGRL